MWKTLLLVAVTANTFFITPSEGTSQRKASSSAYSSSSSSSSQSSAYSSSRSYSSSSSRGKSCSDKPRTPKCKENEVYDKCPAPCPPRECGVDIALILCAPSPKPGDADCKPGCRCADGYLKNRAGACIPKDQCKYDCAKNETLDPCYSSCPPRYCGVNIAAVSCLAVDKCEPGCRCKDEYLRNGDGVCVHENDCPKCPKDEEYDVCPALCPPRRCDVDERVIRCAAPPNLGDAACEPGCRCIDGYVRNPQGKCVTRDQCPPECGENEIYSDCPPQSCRPQECSQVGYPVLCPEQGSECPVEPACICDEGYVKNGTSECIPIKDCPSCGGDPYAIWGCGVNCGRHCSDRNKKEPVACILICYANACDCKDGYFYDDNTQKCVLPEQCTPTCGPNEVLSNCSNGGCGPWTCSDVGYPTGCVKIDPKYCEVGCVCKEGYVRNEDKTCIPIDECPIECTRAHEVYDPCPSSCPPQTCESIGKKYFCPLMPANNTKDCKGACRCEEGYYRNKIGECISKADCPPKCGDNEVYSDCTNGGCQAKNCSQLGQPIPCVKMDPKDCTPGCLCAEGYLRTNNGTCVLEDQCDNCDKPHEHYDPCAKYCPPETCDSIGIEYPCANPPPDCRGACRCDDGYYRNKIGECITKTECMKCEGLYEYFSCGGACDNVCATLYKQNQTNCPIKNIKCNPMYYCEQGYARDENNICIPINECPEPTCGENEMFVQYPPGVCAPRTCSDVGYPVPCADLPQDGSCPEPPACLCNENYVRDDSGTCIPQGNCPSCGGDKNATSGCGVNCGRLCSNYERDDVVCPEICYYNACDCKKGYVLDTNTNKCVKPADCTPPCGEKEVYDICANGGCSKRNCAQLGDPDICIDVIECIGACVCEEGYLRADNGTCIPQNQCPTPKCGVNERFEKCPDWVCAPQSCQEVGYPLNCTGLPDNSDAECPGPPRCICDYNYVRDENWKCIPQKQCPSCGGDRHALSGCGANCGRLCSNYNKGPVPCPKICKVNSCDCKKDYVLDQNTNKCVRPKQCTPICEENEVYSDCTNGGCGPKNCSELGQPIRCVKLDPKYCKKGCLCKEGYLRASNGVCVPEEECDQCNKRNEYYDSCAPSCPPQTCESIGKEYDCPITAQYCRGACRCIEDHYRNKIGECIPKKDCLKCGGPNEYSSCGGACDNVCATLSEQNQTHCPIVNIQCNNMCYCEEGYARDANNICIPIAECPMNCTGPNEHYDCGGACDNVCATLSEQNQTHCPIVNIQCNNMCYCEEGYARDANNICIPIAECPMNCTGPNEHYDCGGACDNVCATLSKQNQTNCPIVNKKCNSKCYCDEGYARDDNDICIPIKQCGVSCNSDPNAAPGCGVNCGKRSDYNKGPVACPAICYLDAPPICEENEVYSDCTNGGCGPKNCSELGQPIRCVKLDPKYCKKGCLCKEGYLRASNGVCVPEEECDQCNKRNEYYDSCAPSCPPQTCESIGREYDCPITAQYCRGACRCIEDHYRNKIGECIPKKDCLKCGGPNEYSSCGGACDNVCATLSEQNQTNCPIVNIQCNNMCYCEEGYARDANNICIPIAECPMNCTGPNEHYDCGGACDNVCATLSEQNQTHCPIVNIQCNNMCYCEEGYARDANNICIPIAECPMNCTGPNEHYDCGGACDNVCATLSKQNQTNCPIVNKKCNSKCYCDEGYARDDNDICIPIKQCGVSCNDDSNAAPGCGVNCGKRSDYNKGPVACPAICYLDAPPECKEYEMYDSCANGGCNRRKCSELVDPILCKDPIECIGDCVCIEGYLRNEDGICVPEAECKPVCNRPHQVYNSCPSTCPPQTCESLERAYICPIEWGEEPPCQPGCVCEEGFYSNKIGECILGENCLKCGGPNEFYSCGGACDNVCATLNKQNQTNCPIVNIQCNSMCYCEEGYARNATNICIPISDCPPPQCGANEINEENPSKVCEPRYCSELGFPLDCASTEDCTAAEEASEDTPACICKQDYVRNECGDCIPKSECPSCGGDKNATAGCGINCGRHCSDYGQEVSCILVCYENACDCKEGYVYDDVTKKCVLYEDCTPTNTTTTPSTVNAAEARAKLDKGSIALANEFLYQLVSSNPDENSVVSGTSVMIPLAQLAIWTEKLILEELLKLFYLNSKDEIKSAFSGLTKSYANQKDVQFEVANICYADEQYPLSTNFKSQSEEYFNSEAENVNFAQSDEAASTINDWVKDRTHGKIEDLVNGDMFSAQTRLVIVNAIYFMSDWVHKFEEDDTKPRDFHKSNGETIQIPIMYQENKFKYTENDKFQALEMPYNGNNFTCLIILPRSADKLLETTEFLRDPDEFSNVYDAMETVKVEVYLPTMRITTRSDMTDMLKKANVTTMFDPSYDGIHGILKQEEPLFVTDVVQKALIELNEKGTTAAAATAVTVTRMSLQNPTNIYVFNANRPFLFYIKFQGMVLFCGAFVT